MKKVSTVWSRETSSQLASRLKLKPNGDNVLATVLALVDEDGNEMESCPHPQQVFYVKLSETPDEFDILRRQENEAIALD